MASPHAAADDGFGAETAGLDDVGPAEVAAAADDDFAEPLDEEAEDDYDRGEAAAALHDFAANCRAGVQAAARARSWDSWAVHEMGAYLKSRIEELTPKPEHRAAREQVIARVDAVVRAGLGQFTGLHVAHYGSYTSGLFTPTGDLDISIEGVLEAHPNEQRKGLDRLEGLEGLNVCELEKDEKAALLRAAGQKLRAKQAVSGRVEFILHARVPIIKFVEARTGIPCDMAVGSGGARFKSTVLRHLASIDGRFADLLRLVKLWAKAFHMNDASNGTFNTFALTLMVVFHLQTRDVPVLPPICELFGLPPDATSQRPLHKGREADLSLLAGSEARAAAWKPPKDGNHESVLQLLHSFFALYSNAIGIWTPSQSIRAVRCCTWAGEWFHRPWTRNYIVPVEDPFDCTDNCARSIFAANVGYVRDCFTAGQHALERLQPGGSIDAAIAGLFAQREAPRIRHPFGPRGRAVGWREAGWGRNGRDDARNGREPGNGRRDKGRQPPAGDRRRQEPSKAEPAVTSLAADLDALDARLLGSSEPSRQPEPRHAEPRAPPPGVGPPPQAAGQLPVGAPPPPGFPMGAFPPMGLLSGSRGPQPPGLPGSMPLWGFPGQFGGLSAPLLQPLAHAGQGHGLQGHPWAGLPAMLPPGFSAGLLPGMPPPQGFPAGLQPPPGFTPASHAPPPPPPLQPAGSQQVPGSRELSGQPEAPPGYTGRGPGQGSGAPAAQRQGPEPVSPGGFQPGHLNQLFADAAQRHQQQQRQGGQQVQKGAAARQVGAAGGGGSVAAADVPPGYAPRSQAAARQAEPQAGAAKQQRRQVHAKRAAVPAGSRPISYEAVD